MKRKKAGDPSLIEDECLACLAFFAYRTERTARNELVKILAQTTRLNEPTERESREGWWKFKFDNMHFAFKQLEGENVRGTVMTKTDKGGAESGKGVQENIKKYALNYFLNDFTLCVDLARRALDAPLPVNLDIAIFGDSDGLSSHSYLSPGDIQVMEEASPEGVRKLRQHWYLERDSSLPRKAKEAFIILHGELFCEVCGIRPVATYGHPLVDAHHKLPLSKYVESGKINTSPSDFSILCPNCHRAVHKQEDCDINQVEKNLKQNGILFKKKI